MGRTTGTGNDDAEATSAGLLSKGHHFQRGAMG
jgi:hypothetical protein